MDTAVWISELDQRIFRVQRATNGANVHAATSVLQTLMLYRDMIVAGKTFPGIKERYLDVTEGADEFLKGTRH